MRHDNHGGRPTLETLESRRLMAVTPLFSADCLPRPIPPGTGNGGVSRPPTPTPTPTPTPKPGHDGNDHEGDGDHHNPTPDVTPAPIKTVIPKVIGNWSGAHATPDKLLGGNLSLEVRQSKINADELSALLDFTGPQDIRWSGQLLYDGQTGHLTMYYLSSKLVARMEATLVTGGQAPTLVGTVEYFTKDGSYKAAFSLRHGVNTLPTA